MKRYVVLLALAIAALGATPSFAQQVGSTGQPATPVTLQTQYPMTPITQTGAVNAQVTLTVPAPPAGLYNYMCSLHFNASQNATASALTNQVTTSTNFGSYAIKFSYPATVNGSYDWVEYWGIANVGCVKSTASGTATTFVSPAAATNTAFTWTATYYQAP